MGHVDGSDTQVKLQPLDLTAHRNSQAGVKVRKRLVKEEQTGLLRQGAPKGHALLLAAGELAWFSVPRGG